MPYPERFAESRLPARNASGIIQMDDRQISGSQACLGEFPEWLNFPGAAGSLLK
jgi:hypothetical protein